MFMTFAGMFVTCGREDCNHECLPHGRISKPKQFDKSMRSFESHPIHVMSGSQLAKSSEEFHFLEMFRGKTSAIQFATPRGAPRQLPPQRLATLESNKGKTWRTPWMLRFQPIPGLRALKSARPFKFSCQHPSWQCNRMETLAYIRYEYEAFKTSPWRCPLLIKSMGIYK
jgi:hypothetical protein